MAGLLDGRVAVVSGIGPGLGRHVALALAREGAAVVMGARTEARLEEVAKEIADLGGRAAWATTDIRDPEQCRRLTDTALGEFGRIDTLVNNAFRTDTFEPFESVELDQWRKVFDVNVFGSLQMCQAVLPAMKDAGGGSIVFVNSMVVRKMTFPQGGYASSKGALLVAARALAQDLGSYGIRVNSIVPGWMAGPGFDLYLAWQSAEQGRPPEEIQAGVEAGIALGRVPTDEETAGAIVFLASDLSSAVTGQAIDVNGGEVFH